MGLRDGLCDHFDNVGGAGWTRCDRPLKRKAWRHRHTPDLRASWLCQFHSYNEYLETGHWAFIRQRKLNSVGRRCEGCGIPESQLPSGRAGLHIHHRTYARFGDELLDDLEVLCSACHDQRHRIAVQ